MQVSFMRLWKTLYIGVSRKDFLYENSRAGMDDGGIVGGNAV
jgi:hypothetical protein